MFTYRNTVYSRVQRLSTRADNHVLVQGLVLVSVWTEPYSCIVRRNRCRRPTWHFDWHLLVVTRLERWTQRSRQIYLINRSTFSTTTCPSSWFHRANQSAPSGSFWRSSVPANSKSISSMTKVRTHAFCVLVLFRWKTDYFAVFVPNYMLTFCVRNLSLCTSGLSLGGAEVWASDF